MLKQCDQGNLKYIHVEHISTSFTYI